MGSLSTAPLGAQVARDHSLLHFLVVTYFSSSLIDIVLGGYGPKRRRFRGLSLLLPSSTEVALYL